MVRSLVVSTALAWMLSMSSFSVAGTFDEALKAFKEKDYRRSVEILDDLIRDRPNSFRAIALRGRALVELSEFDRAIADLDVVIEEKEEAGVAHYFRGRAYMGMKPPKLDEAIADLNKAIEINPKVADWHYERGRAYSLRSELDPAFRDVHQAIAIDPDQPLYYLFRGNIQIGRASHWEAVNYEKNGQTYQYYRMSIRDQDLFEQGIADFGRVLEKEPNNLDALQARRSAFEVSQQMGKMLEDLRAIVKICPNDHTSWNLLGWVLATSRDESLRDGKEAVAAAEKACELTQFKAWQYLDSLAAAYAESKRFKKAVETQEKAIENLDPDTAAEAKMVFEERLELYKKKQPYREGPEPR